jgi:hypothetical protein
MSASIFFTAAVIRAKGTERCSSKEYRCTIVDACLERPWISYRCVPCHPWYTHRTSQVVKKYFSFPVAVNNSFKVGPLIFLLSVFVITENIMKRPVFTSGFVKWSTQSKTTEIVNVVIYVKFLR